ncbi:MAG: undecaprenyldiphospho-muramoylpentapeptide beta-N-acetylglucosaminyltransferase [Gammaproteobacteria bacterium]|nr:MAG: undecaprenyldiphospho-muramoylpentapeptide beta-N-acetylglucosaminyltransferase [Gammaproteobacteria bacterium]
MVATEQQAPVLIMAGGTGGHIFPALAVADSIQEHNAPVIWLGTEKGLESKIIPKEGIDIEYIRIGGLRGKGFFHKLIAPFKIVDAVVQALKIIRRIKPRSALGMGGYVTGPGGVAAWISGVPLYIHEQNAVAGMTNKILSHFAKKVFEAFPGSFAQMSKLICSGNPVRKEFYNLKDAQTRFTEREGRINVLVLGGSLGAKVLNEVVPEAVSRIDVEHRPNIRHQAGEKTIEIAHQQYEQAEVLAEVTPFIDHMAQAFEWADLIICRAGALTIAEIAVVGVPAILVPFPHAVDDHQTRNARYLSTAGAAVLIPQNMLTADSLYKEMVKLIQDKSLRIKMAIKAKELAREKAAEMIADSCLSAEKENKEREKE